MSISLPAELLRQFEAVRKAESRTRSELVREALREYFASRYPAVQASPEELRALRRGRAAFRRGDALLLKEFLNGLGSTPRRTRSKAISKAARKGPVAR